MESFYSEEEIKHLGLKSYGNNVRVSRKVSIYAPEMIKIGDNVRIDDFCVLSGSIVIGSNVHIAAYCALYGGEGITIGDYSGLSARCTLYSVTDDFSGNFLVGSCVNNGVRNLIRGKIEIKRYVQVGAGCVVLPGVLLNEGVAVGAMSLVNKTLPQWSICYGIPAKWQRERSKNLLNYVQ